MVSLTATPDPDSLPPDIDVRLQAATGAKINTVTISRIKGGVETVLRRQPATGTDGTVSLDVEAPYEADVTYHATGTLTPPSVSSKWAGTARASNSLLLLDGTTIATNRIPAATPVHGDPWSSRWSSADTIVDPGILHNVPSIDGKRWQAGLMYPSNPDDTAPAAQSGFSPLIEGAGDYVLVWQQRHTGPTASNVKVSIGYTADSKTWTMKFPTATETFDGANWVWRMVPFTVSSAGRIAFYLETQAETPFVDGDAFDFNDFGLYTAAEYAAMKASGVFFFDGTRIVKVADTSFDVKSTAVTLSTNSGWLIHPANPAKSMAVPSRYVTSLESVVRPSSAVRHDVMRSRYPVFTIPGQRRSRQFTLKLRTQTSDDESLLAALTADQIPILINFRPSDRIPVDPIYAQILDVQEDPFAQMAYPSGGPGAWRVWQLACVEVDSPAVVQDLVGWTYTDLRNTERSYADLLTHYASYADVQANTPRS